jgi:hypothetical protein
MEHTNRHQSTSIDSDILNTLRVLIDNYSRSHQMYMMPIETMVHHMNSPSSAAADASLLIHLHRRMSEYHHTMREIFQFVRQIHQPSRVVATTTTPPPLRPDAVEVPQFPPTNNRIAESILNALLQSSAASASDTSFTFTLYPNEDESIPHHITDAHMEQYTETYAYHEDSESSPSTIPDTSEESDTDTSLEPTLSGSDVPCATPRLEPTSSVLDPVSSPNGTGLRPPSLVPLGSNHRTCPITLEDFEPGESVTKIKVCGHVFRAAALRSWLNRHQLCPVCRRDICV